MRNASRTGAGLGLLGPLVRVAGEATLGKQSHDFTRRQRFGRGSERVGRLIGAALDGDEADSPHQAAEHGHPEHAGGRQHPGRPPEPPTHHREEDAIGVGGVIGDHDHGTVRKRLHDLGAAAHACDLEPRDDRDNGAQQPRCDGVDRRRRSGPGCRHRLLIAADNSRRARSTSQAPSDQFEITVRVVPVVGSCSERNEMPAS